MKDFISINLHFPNKSSPILKNTELTNFFKNYFKLAHDLFLEDGYDGKNDGLVEFSVSYNGFHEMYDISVCGGTHYKEKTQKLIDILTELGYDVEALTYTWASRKAYEPINEGLRFYVYQKRK